MPYPGASSSGDWCVFAESGTIQRQSNPVLREALEVAGWACFNTQAEAKAFASSNPVGQVKSGITSTTDFLNLLNQRQTWIRIAEGALGLGLILVAITHITGAGKVSNLPAHIVKNGIKVAAA